MNTKELKKVVLHLHLDGSVRISTMEEILGRKLDGEVQINDKCNSLEDYLKKFELPISIMQTTENLSRIAYELAQDLKSDNVIYAEIRFAPMLHTKLGLSIDEVVESVIDGLNKVDIKTNLILCMMRHLSYEDNEKIIYLAQKYDKVCAIDLAGDEAKYKTSSFEKLFDLANSLNLNITIHAGEADGSDSISSAISFGAKRIGHGINCINNDEVINKIIDKNITLEICPTSNIQTNVVDEYKNHPIKKIIDKGIIVTISTDNNTVSKINLSKEYDKLIENFKFAKEDFLKLNINAVNASFINNSEKENIINKLIKNYK